MPARSHTRLVVRRSNPISASKSPVVARMASKVVLPCERDGVDFVAVILVGRTNIKGGETRVFEANGPKGQRFTMTEPWTLLLLDDAAVIHESTPIQPVGDNGHRDTLVLTWRAGAFQGDDADTTGV